MKKIPRIGSVLCFDYSFSKFAVLKIAEFLEDDLVLDKNECLQASCA